MGLHKSKETKPNINFFFAGLGFPGNAVSRNIFKGLRDLPFFMA